MNARPAAAILSLFTLALLATVTAAGPTDPPVGPVAPTGKTTQEIFDKVAEVESRIAINATNTPGDADSLFKITQPGSYYLTGNIIGEAGKHGIEIAASGVTLDLNGFDLVGIPAMGAFDGVNATIANLSDIAIINGSIRNWGDEGVDLGNDSSNCRVDRISASSNVGHGIRVGVASTVFNCKSYRNTGNGILTAIGTVDSGSTVLNCTAYQNTGAGIVTGGSSAVSHCTASLNTLDGINIDDGTVSNCTALNNTGSGIDIGTGTVSNCTTNENAGAGIDVNAGTVANCTSKSNTLDGIRCGIDCIIISNVCSTNGSLGVGAGIRVTSSRNRIEGNNCVNADRGIVLQGVNNVMIKNTCSNNIINYEIIAGNRYGPVINITAPNAATVSGNTAASTMSSTDPWANFAY